MRRPLLVPNHFLRLIDGTAAAPSLAFANDPDTGIYRPAANTLGIVTGGADRVRIDANGAVFVNATSNADMTTGILVNQGATTNQSYAAKASTVGHGATGLVETDTYWELRPRNASGGILLRAYMVGSVPMTLTAIGSVDDTTKATTSEAYHSFDARKISGTTAGAIGTNANIARFSDNGTVVALVDKEGDLWLNGALSVNADHAGIAGTVAFTNQQNTATARSTGVGTIKFADATARDNVGFLKIMVGTTAYYTPLFAAN